MSWLVNQLATLFLNMIVQGFNGIANMFLGVIAINGKESLDLFWRIFLPSVKSGSVWMIMVSMGLMIEYMISIFSISKSYLGPMARSEHPFQVLLKTMFFSILVVYSADICGWFLDIARLPFAVMATNSGVDGMDMGYDDPDESGLGDKIYGVVNGLFYEILNGDNSGEGAKAKADKDNLIQKAFGVLKKMFELILFEAITMIFATVVVAAIAWNYLKMIIEIAERYVVLGLLCLFSPLCIATGVSESTSSTFKSWCRVMISQMILTILALFFVRVFQGAVNRITSVGLSSQTLADGKTMYHPIIGLVFLLSWLRIGQRVDNYLGTLGLTAIAAGDGLFADMLGGSRAIAMSGRAIMGAAGAATTAFGAAGAVKAASKAGKGGILGAPSALKNGLGAYAKSEQFKRQNPGMHRAMTQFGNMKKAWRNGDSVPKTPEEAAKMAKKAEQAKTTNKAAHEQNKKTGFKSTGDVAKDAMVDQFGNTKLDNSDKTLSDYLKDGAEIKAAEMDENGGIATLKDKDGREFNVAFGEGIDGKSGRITAADPSSVVGQDLYGKPKEKGTKEDANDVLAMNDASGGDIAGEGSSEEIQGNEDNQNNIQMDKDGDFNAAGMTTAPTVGDIEDGGNSPSKDVDGENFRMKADVDNAIQDGAHNGMAVDANGKQESVSGLVDNKGFVKNGVDIKKDENGNSFIVGNNGKAVPVSQFGENGYRVNGFQSTLNKNNQAVGLDGKSHDISNLKNANGELNKSKLQKTAAGGAFYTANDGAIIPASGNGAIESVSQGISQSGQALDTQGNITKISSDHLNSNGTINTSKASSDGNGKFTVPGQNGSQVPVNMSTGGAAGIVGDNQQIATAIDKNGNLQDVSSYVGSNGKVDSSMLSGPSGAKTLDIGNGVSISAGDDGSLSGMQISQGVGTAGVGNDGMLHNVSGSVDPSTGLAKADAIKTDAQGSFVRADDGARVAVSENGSIQGAVTKSGANAATVNPSTGQTDNISRASAAAGGFMLGSMILGNSGKGSVRTDSGSMASGSYGYSSSAPSFSVANNSSQYVAPEAITPSTGTISPSYVEFHSDGTMSAPGINGGSVPVMEHAPGLYTPMVGSTYNSSASAGHQSMKVNIGDDSPLLSHSYSADSSLASGYSVSQGSLGSYIQTTGGEYAELSPRGITSNGSGIQRYNSLGSADPKGNYTYTMGSSGIDQLSEISGTQTYNPTSYSGPVAIRTNDSGDGRYRTVHSDGMSSSGGVLRFDANGRSNPSGNYVMCNASGGGYQFVEATTSSSGNISTYQQHTSLGNLELQRSADGGYAIDTSGGGQVVHSGDGTARLDLNNGGSFEIARSSIIGKDSVNYPQVSGKNGESYCLVPNTQFHYNGSTSDFASSLRGTAASGLVNQRIDLGSGIYTPVSDADISRSYGKGQSDDAYYVSNSMGGYDLATRDQMNDFSVPKYTQRLANGTGNIQSVFNKTGDQKASSVNYSSNLSYVSNASNGKVLFTTSNADVRYDANNDPITQGYALIPAQGMFGHNLDRASLQDGQDVQVVEKNGMEYYLTKVSLDKNHNVTSGLEAFKPPQSGQGVFSSRARYSINRGRIKDTNMQPRDTSDFMGKTGGKGRRLF